MDHWQPHTIDRAPASGVRGKRCHGPHADPAPAAGGGEQLGVRDLQHNRVKGVAGKEVLGLVWIPSGQVDGGTVLEGVTNRVQHIGLDPERVTCLAGPDTQAGIRDDGLTGGPLRADLAHRMRIDRLAPSIRRTTKRCFCCSSRASKVMR